MNANDAKDAGPHPLHAENAMREDRRQKPSGGSVVLWCVAFVLLCPPIGSLVGLLLGLISDFGLGNTVGSIRANPKIFVEQYAGPLVSYGWTALVCLIAVLVIVGIRLMLIWRRKNG